MAGGVQFWWSEEEQVYRLRPCWQDFELDIAAQRWIWESEEFQAKCSGRSPSVSSAGPAWNLKENISDLFILSIYRYRALQLQAIFMMSSSVSSWNRLFIPKSLCSIKFLNTGTIIWLFLLIELSCSVKCTYELSNYLKHWLNFSSITPISTKPSSFFSIINYVLVLKYINDTKKRIFSYKNR